MYLDINYHDALKGLGTDVIIQPDEKENPDVLHNYSVELLVVNPAVTFTQEVKAGKFDDISDEEYEALLKPVKDFNERFFNKQPRMNIFALAAAMAGYILNTGIVPPSGEDENSDK